MRSRPRAGFLPSTKTANIPGSQAERPSDFRREVVPCGCHFVFSNLERLILGESIPSLRVAPECAIAAAAHILDNLAHAGLKDSKVRGAASQMFDHLDRLLAREDPHHNTTLLSGYSTMP